MSLTHQRVIEVANQVKSLSEEAKKLYLDCVELLETNSDLSIDWAGDPKPSYINEDADGNLDGFRFTRGNVANLIGSIDNIRKLFEAQAVTQGDHLGNINQVSNANV